ncbi:MAG: prepilin-type N-terminal cleavage/methylation domain-containing protein [Verrucomicrobia bacterium]|nr:prepilin-type N-terminal cleavage/methylation domain-containing protein [Verrucomicrobiota bacterium]
MKTGTSSTTRRGMSLVELLISISIVAILLKVALTSFTSYFGASQDTVASSLLETVNTAVHRFNECNYELNVPPVSDIYATTELAIIRTLQYRNPLNPKVGSPYINKRWNPVASSSTSDFRLQWKGTLFILLAPATEGTGLKVDFKTAVMGTPYTYTQGYTMAGS